MNGLKEFGTDLDLTFGQNIKPRATTGRPYGRDSSCIERHGALLWVEGGHFLDLFLSRNAGEEERCISSATGIFG
jgi:hypothetical protein